MDESAGELDEAFVEAVIRCPPLGQPKLLEDIVGFVEPLAIEAFEVAEVMRINSFSTTTFDQGSDFSGFFAQPGKGTRLRR